MRWSYTDTRPLAPEARIYAQAATLKHMAQPQFVICTYTSGYEVSLEARKLYQVIQDEQAESLNQIRVINKSGEDHLYPTRLFVHVDLPAFVADQVTHAV
jgi:hypothetical protein